MTLIKLPNGDFVNLELIEEILLISENGNFQGICVQFSGNRRKVFREKEGSIIYEACHLKRATTA